MAAGRVRLVLAEVSRSLGRTEEARDHLRTAHEVFRDIGALAWRRQARGSPRLGQQRGVHEVVGVGAVVPVLGAVGRQRPVAVPGQRAGAQVVAGAVDGVLAVG
ncbi:hypothetical protein SVIOM342S_07963 [Streptomyces violaceorubidus]